MSTTQQLTDQYTEDLEQLLDNLEQALAMSDFACVAKTSELNEAVIFKYFSTMSAILFKTKVVALRLTGTARN